MMKSLANVVRGKTARACDSCVKRRARWYCAANDAFFCHSCDRSVHSANLLARRHERVRLKSASDGKHRHASPPAPATWHQGFRRKARTPRGGKKSQPIIFHVLVPEMSTEDQAESYDVGEQLIHQVPDLNLMVEDQCLNESMETEIKFPKMPVWFKSSDEKDDDNAESCLNGLFPTDMQMAQFTADVETLLGGGTEREFHTIEELGLGEMSKVEKEELVEGEKGAATREVYDLNEADANSPFEISFDYKCTQRTTSYEEEDEKEDVMKNEMEVEMIKMSGKVKEEMKEKSLMLRLDYKSVISTLGGQGIPWTARKPSELDLDMVCFPTNYMGKNGAGAHYHNRYRTLGLHMGEAGDGGREARVSRYREKRRTRLFSKKIRYEVRKLNAEKRPRMKGRFGKRSSFGSVHLTH